MGVRLPAEYQEVEYIETTGTQYIQTSYTPQNADEIVCDFAVVGSIVGAANAQVLFSAGTGTNQLIFLLNNTSGATPVDGAYYKYFASGDAARLFFYPSYDTKYRLEIGNDGTANCNGYSVQSNYEGTVNTALRLMQRANGRSSFKGKCYQFILSNGGEVKLHLIPCYRKTDDKPGMYDLVSGAFFVNAGTGEFTVGHNVIDSISPLMVAWRRALMKAPLLDTSPRIAEYGKYLNRSNTGTGSSEYWCYTEWYDIDPVPGIANRLQIGNCEIDGGRTYQYTTSAGGANWDYRASGEYYTLPGNANTIRISIPIANLLTCYACIKTTGQILFAGKNTPYYGYTNINDMPQG